MPIGTSNGEYFEDENDHAYQTHFAGKVTDPIQVPDKFLNAPRTSTAPYRGNLGDILGMDVHDIPEGVSARDYFQQLQRQTDENYKTNTQKPVTMAPQKGASMEDPTGARDLFLVRHGCTDLNGEGGTSTDKIRGWSDVPLNDIGRDDARRAGDSLKRKGITAIVASDLSRAKETADIIGQKIGVTPTYTMKLRPWDLGKFTGEPADESREALKEYSTTKTDVKVPGGESFDDFRFRALDGVGEALRNHPNDQVAIVTHHRVERLLNAWDEQGQPTDGELHEPTFLQKGEPPGGHQIINISPNIHMVANDKGQPGSEGPYYEYDDNSEIHLNSMKEYNDNIHKIPDNWENIIQDKAGKVTIKGPKYTPPLVG